MRPKSFSRKQAVLGTDHCEIGGAFGVRNGLPAALNTVIQQHHRPENAEAFQELVALVAMADQMARRFEDVPNLAMDEPCDNLCISLLAERERVRDALEAVTPKMARDAATEARRLIA